MTTNVLQDQIEKVQKRITGEANKGKKKIKALRVKAADAALSWVMSNDSLIKQFRSAVKGTPVSSVLDALIDLLKSEGSPKKKAPAKKVVAKKVVAKKAVKKTARKR